MGTPLTGTSLKNLFSKPATKMYPFEPFKPFDATKGSVQIGIEDCIFCGMCMRNCPAGAIEVDRAAKSWSINRLGCVTCYDCINSCPKKCLEMSGQYAAAVLEPEITTYVKPEPEPEPEPEVVEAEPEPETDAEAPAPEGGVTIDVEKCLFCGMCARNCPVEAIKVDRDSKSWIIDDETCVKCGACVGACPVNCLSMGEKAEPESEPELESVAEPEVETEAETEVEAPADGVTIDVEKCLFCGMCMRNCPVEAIKVDRDSKSWIIDDETCVKCGACIGACPVQCLSLAK